MAIRKARLLCITLTILLASTACSSGAEKTNIQTPQVLSESAVEVADNAHGVQVSDTSSSGFLGSQFDQTKAVAKGTAFIDVSSVADGYVAVAATADKRLKFQVICGNATYNYDMANNGKPSGSWRNRWGAGTADTGPSEQRRRPRSGSRRISCPVRSS